MCLSSKPEMLMLYSYIKLIDCDELSELRVVESEGQAVVIFILSIDTTLDDITQYRAVSLFPTRTNDGIAVISLFKPSSVKGKC